MRAKFGRTAALTALAAAVMLVDAGSGAAHEGHHHTAPAPSATAEPWQAASPRIQDAEVVDESGRRRRFASDLLAGRVVAVNFFFGDCGTTCPVAASTFAEVRDQLGARAGREVALLSVSIDPRRDTPERLRGIAQDYGVAPGWSLLTGAEPALKALARGLAGSVPALSESHPPLVLIGSLDAGYWVRTLAGGDPEAVLRGIAHVEAEAQRIEAARRRAATGAGFDAAAAMHGAALVAEDGRRVDLVDDLLRDRLAVLNFMYTECTGTCLLSGDYLATLRDLLGEEAGRGVNIVSVSVDPATDTPAALSAYADRFGGAGRGWTLLTGEAAATERVYAAVARADPRIAANASPGDREAHLSTLFFYDDRRKRLWPFLLHEREADRFAALVRRLAAERRSGG